MVAVAADSFEIDVRDPDDTRILAEPIAGHAEVLVTRDRDLLELAVHAGVAIPSARGFWERLAGRSIGQYASSSPRGSSESVGVDLRASEPAVREPVFSPPCLVLPSDHGD